MRLVLGVILACAAGRFCAASGVSIEPPPGWRDVTAEKNYPDVLAALKGPEMSSLVLTRMDPVALSNRAAVRALLLDILEATNAKSGLKFQVKGDLRAATYRNDLTAYYLEAHPVDAPGASGSSAARPKMILALTEYAGVTILATLISAVPETLIASLLGAVRASGQAAQSPAAPAEEPTVSLDGQLALALPEGLRPRALGEREKAKGFVLAIKGLESELWVIRVPEAGSTGREESQAVQDTVLALERADAASRSPSSFLPTPAGPPVIYAWARDARGGSGQLVAGFLPWCYWGYSLLAEGPAAVELLKSSFQTLRLGPAAVPKLVAATPRMGAPGGINKALIAASAALLAVLGALALRIRKR